MTSVQPKQKERRVVISGIGTGGHYFPAVVLAQELIKQNVAVVFLVRKGYNEEKMARLYGLQMYAVAAKGFYGTKIIQKCLSLVSLMYSVCMLNVVTRRAVGIAFGGFGSLPLILSCMLNRCPFYIFEPNRIPGRATKLFARKARCVFLGLPLYHPLAARTALTGVPIRHEFKHITYRFSDKKKRHTALFIGGSQGARVLNLRALEMQKLLPPEWRIVIVSGERDFEWVSKERDDRTTVIGFSLSVWEVLKQSSVVVSRAGALAGYEIMASGRPVLFIPFPYAVDNHQYFNAEYFARTGNAMVMREDDATPAAIAQAVMDLEKKTDRTSSVLLDAEIKIAETVLREWS
jgi:UDP-N-acetylglucosamine--N-acetylmuramyl-(pentapeptide) pyrophosphoryl-undecaprenol N-acetylglucosamine transferase